MLPTLYLNTPNALGQRLHNVHGLPRADPTAGHARTRVIAGVSKCDAVAAYLTSCPRTVGPKSPHRSSRRIRFSLQFVGDITHTRAPCQCLHPSTPPPRLILERVGGGGVLIAFFLLTRRIFICITSAHRGLQIPTCAPPPPVSPFPSCYD